MSEGIIIDYRNSLDKEIATVTRKLAAGNAKDYAEYMAMVREIRAYTRAKSNFADEVRKYQEEEDIDNNQEINDDD
jgi:hypothetical protein